MTVHLEATIPATLEQLYELLTDGVLFGPATGMPGEGKTAARGFQHPRRPHLEPSEPDVLYSDAPGTLHVSRPRRFGVRLAVINELMQSSRPSPRPSGFD
jgi:hypothetical protein